MIVIAVVLAIALLIVLGVNKSQKEKARLQEEAQRQAAYEQQKIDVATLVVIPFAQLYGFDDMICNAANIPDTGISSAVFTSEKFGQATDEEKLAFLSDVKYYSDQLPIQLDDQLYNRVVEHGLTVKVISNEYSYAEWITDDKSQLRRASAEDAYSTSANSPYKDVIFSMETLHSKDVAASLGSNDGCKKCGETGVALTAGGYCKVCVDIYYTDYYVGLDGKIYADRPY